MSSAAQTPGPNEKREFLRHVLATLAYRGAKALRGAPEDFARFAAAEKVRTPGQLLAHVCDLLEWSRRVVEHPDWRAGWQPIPSQAWDVDVDRFFGALKSLDDYLASGEPLAVSSEVLFQGPISDALTHVGQLAMLRRMAGSPIRGEVMVIADIVSGRVGPDQSPPKHEFD